MRTTYQTTAATAALVFALGIGGAMADSITAVSWGGAYTKSQLEAYHKPFMAETGITVNSEDYNGGLAQVRAQVEAGNVTWNVVDFELSDIVRGCDEGLLEEIDWDALPPAPDGTPAREDFIEGTLHECGVGLIVWSTVYAFDSSKVSGDAPSNMADFFDTGKYAGKRGMRKNPKANLEFALIADGVPTDQVYEILSTEDGVDRAFAKLDSVKDEVLWWEAGAQPPQMLADGEVVMSTAYNGRLFNAIVKEGKPFVIVWDGQVWDLDLWGIPKGSGNRGETMDFVKFSSDTQRLADQTKWISYGPVRKSSMALIAPDMLPHMPTYGDNFKNALQNNFEWWADHQDEMNERFTAWLAQ